MRKLLFIISAVVLLASCGSAGKINKADQKWSYEIQSAGVGVDGTYAVRVWSYSRSPQLSTEVSKMNAVHGVIFRGVPAGNGSISQPALAPSSSVEEQNAEFFDKFFAYDFSQFVSQVAQGSTQTIKTGKNEYKVGVILSVSKDKLRKYLEDNGIIKSLNSGF